jgi:predicted membrane protein
MFLYAAGFSIRRIPMAYRYWFGSMLVVLGAGLLVDKMYPALDFGHWIGLLWPLAIILLGALLLLTRSSTWVGGILIIFFGGILQLIALGIMSENVWGLLCPSLLILMGILIVFRLGRPGIAGDRSADALNNFVLFSGMEARPQTANFRGGSVTAIFGGAEIDLRGATLAKEGALLELTAAFGGVNVTIPKDWRLDINGIPFFGGWSDKTSAAAPAGSPVLTVRCLAMFGGVEIKN